MPRFFAAVRRTAARHPSRRPPHDASATAHAAPGRRVPSRANVWWRTLLLLTVSGVALPSSAPVATAWAAPRLPTGMALRIGLPAQAMPLRSDTRDYTAEALETLYAQTLADTLGLRIEWVEVPDEALAQALIEGQIDVALTRSAPAAPRPVGLSGLNSLDTGWRSGLSATLRRDTPVRQWADLRGRTVCTSAGNLHAQRWAQGLGATVRVSTAPAQALARVRTGDCDAVVGDAAPLAALRARDDWAKFSATLPNTDAQTLTLLTRTPRSPLTQAVLQHAATHATSAHWQQQAQRWAAQVAFEVYVDQTGPDCH